MRGFLPPWCGRFVGVHTARSLLLAGVVALGRLTSAVAAEPAYSFRNPLSPQQCERAVRAGRQALAQDDASIRAQMLLAEGLLCEGLEDDPGSLDAAIDLLRDVVVRESRNFFAQLELADALRKRFPLSHDAQTSLRRARQLLASADVGAARSELADYIDENLGAVEQQRIKALPVLRNYEITDAQGALSSAGVVQLADLLALTGSAGLTEARAKLDRYLGEHPDDAVAELHRAEIWRGSLPRAESRNLYSKVAARLCQSGTDGPKHTECELAKWRLRQLEQMGDRGGA